MKTANVSEIFRRIQVANVPQVVPIVEMKQKALYICQNWPPYQLLEDISSLLIIAIKLVSGESLDSLHHLNRFSEQIL